MSGDLALPDPGRLIARIDSVGDDEDHRVSFHLDRATDVVVVAQGELSDDSEYDVARIERATGERVWEMSWANTVPGGEALFHRRFEGTVRLEPGTYVLRYESDGSASFGDFGPSSEVLWGVHVYGPPAGTPPPAPAAPSTEKTAPPAPPAPPAPTADV